MNFLGLQSPQCDYANARYAVLPLPYDATTSYRPGTRLGPDAILDASAQVETFDQELRIDASEAGVFTADPVHAVTTGPADYLDAVAAAASPLVADGKFLLGLGGEHSVTGALVRAVVAAGGKGPLGVLQIDAHGDLRSQYEGSPHSHASVMRRLHEDLGLAISPVGIRSFCAEEQDYMDSMGIEPLTPWRIATMTPDQWIDEALAKLPERVYITVDIDGFDPAYAPGTGTPEPGGLDWRQVTALVRAACERKTVVAADVVEVMPIPGQHVTEFLAARLAYKLMTFHYAKEKKG